MSHPVVRQRKRLYAVRGLGNSIMILAQLAAATLAFGVATSPGLDAPARRLSLQQKNAATQLYVGPLTDCIARSVVADDRFRKEHPTANLGDLIVDAMPKCLEPAHAMIAAYDRYFGDGSGEKFFMGPYLDLLPDVLMKRMERVAE